MLVPENTIDSTGVFVPFIYMLCYAGIPIATHLGYYFGYTQKFNKDDIMYQKRYGRYRKTAVRLCEQRFFTTLLFSDDNHARRRYAPYRDRVHRHGASNEPPD